jgi:flagellar biosynthesis protein FlhG
MQDNEAHAKDCHLLGIEADSTPEDAERAWRNLKAIYAEDSFATYGLIEDAERQEKLEELEGAYKRIASRFNEPAAEQPFPAGNLKESLPQLSPVESVGRLLRQLRENSGLTLGEIAHRTKISPMRLDQIEQEMFERLPATVYLRGFVLEYAKVLGFPQPQEVAGAYLARYKERVPCS